MVSEVPTDEGPAGPVGPDVGGGVGGREFDIYKLLLNK